MVEAAERAGVAAWLAADLSVREEVGTLAAAAGPIDILVNNAGLQHLSPVDQFSEERLDSLLAVMLVAPFLLCKAVLPGMYDRQWGRVVNIASVHGLVASRNKAAYVMAKHGLLGLTKTLALEAAERSRDVTAHSICPSYVSTPLVEKQVREQAVASGRSEEQVLAEIVLESNAVRRLIAPDDVAASAVWLCGPAAWTMTGAALTMDAGWLSH